MAALVDKSHSQRGTKEVNSEHSSRGSSSMNNSCCKLIQEATTTRKQPGSPPKRLNLKHWFLFHRWNMQRSHFAKGKQSYPRYQSMAKPPKSVPDEQAFFISKVTVRFFSKTRIIRLFRLRSRYQEKFTIRC